RFFEAHFRQEIDEHSTRMRELISGRDGAVTPGVDTGVSWGIDDPDDEIRRERAAQSARRRRSSLGMDAAAGGLDDALGDEGADAPGLLSELFDDLGGGSRVEDDDEMPAERTRIESNPLERVNELERLAALTPPRPTGSGRMPAAPQRLPTPPPTL